MATPSRSTPRPSAFPASQNTAPVAEFRCLFTHDLRRKQKRWHDGYLKFHSFNNRVMVYDTSRNFLGDTYWKESNELHEGDELTLDKGVMVEVADAVGVTQTDLTPLFEKKTKESPPRPNGPPPVRPLPRTAVPASNAPRAGSQLRHKSLNTLLGTSRGLIGKSVSPRSPYETRREKENEYTEERVPKRLKTAHHPMGLRTSSPVQEQSHTANKNLPLWAKTSDANHARAPSKPTPQGAIVISLDSEPDGISSDVTLPSTPPGTAKLMTRLQPTTAPAGNQAIPEIPAAQTPKLPKGSIPLPHIKAQATPKQPMPTLSPPVSASNRLSNIDFAIQPLKEPIEVQPLLKSPPRKPKAKSLRLSKGAKRGTLLCQSLPLYHTKVTNEPEPPLRRSKEKNASRHSIDECGPLVLHDNEHLVASEIQNTNDASTMNEAKRRPPIAPSGSGLSKEVKTATITTPRSSLHLEDMEVMHGLMDQQLIVSPLPPKPKEVLKSMSPLASKARHSKPVAPRKAPIQDQTMRSSSPHKVAKTLKSKLEQIEKPRSKKKAREIAQSHCIDPSPTLLAHEHPMQLSKNSSPASVQGVRHVRTASASPNEVALSTGGFHKKAKRNQAQPQTAPPNPDVLAARPTGFALPPCPLRANRSAPLLSTTELSALLQKPQKLIRLEDDPIEDGTQGAVVSPNRSFKRVRSENDAPIPSASKYWEKRNLAHNNSKSSKAVEPGSEPKKRKAGGLAALVKKTDPKRKFQRTQSLSVDTNVHPVEDMEIVTPPADDDVGPWSTEAFDLFDWRPPNQDGEKGKDDNEDRWRVSEVREAFKSASTLLGRI